MNVNDVEELYRELYQKKVKLMTKITRGDRALAEDVVQETFTRAVKYCHVYNEDLSNPETWINSIMFNVLRTMQRENKSVSFPRSDGISVEDILEEDLLKESPEFRLFLLKKINELGNEKHQKVLRLFFLFGYSSREISEMGLDISQTNVTTVVNRFKEGLV